MIFLANKRNVKDMEEYKEYCCDCYYVSLNPTKHGIDDDIKFDLSYCLPECADCGYCSTYFDENPVAAFNYNDSTCPMPGYSSRPSSFNWDWDSDTQCHSKHISYKSFEFWAKSYTAYGIMAIFTVSLYSLGLLALMFYVYGSPKISMVILGWILIYNVLISEILLYLLFKPFQYYAKNLVVGDNAKDIVCEINSIHDRAALILSFTIYVSMSFVALHLMYIVYKVSKYCIHCCVSYGYDYRLSQDSVLLDDMQEQINYGTGGFKLLKHRCRWGFFGIVVCLLMIFFFGICIYATYKMIEAGHQHYDQWKINIIAGVMALIFLSLIDNPWIYYKLNSYARRNDTYKINNPAKEIMLHPVPSN